MTKDIFQFPEPPHFSSDIINNCEKIKDYRVVFFEYYKYVGILVATFTSIEFTNPINPKITMIDW